tara:strand:- start:430 stop:615 length:186 start_codon:yes stop_codon:yes gene_type:complete
MMPLEILPLMPIEQTSCDMLENEGELADEGGMPAPLVEFVVVDVDVVVFVCPSLLFVVVLS